MWSPGNTRHRRATVAGVWTAVWAALTVVAVGASARAQQFTGNWVRGGVHDTPDRAIAPSTTVSTRWTLDVNGDGSDDLLMELAPDGSDDGDPRHAHTACVVVIRQGGGWTARVVGEAFEASCWGADEQGHIDPRPVVVGGRVFLVMHGEPEAPGTQPRFHLVSAGGEITPAWAGRSRAAIVAYEALADGSVLVVAGASRRRRYLTLRWDAATNRLLASRWSRQRPAGATEQGPSATVDPVRQAR